MYRDGHVGFNAALYAPFAPLVSDGWSLELAMAGAVLAVVTATLPDVDQPLPRLRHRGPTHTVWFALLVGLVAGAGTALVLPSTPAGFRFGLVVGTGGVLAHLAGDVVTPMGISPLAPVVRTHVTLNWFASKNARINRTVWLAGSAALLASLVLTVGLSAGITPTG